MKQDYMTAKERQLQFDKKQRKKIPVLDKNFDYLTTQQVAEQLQTTPNEISALCRGGYFEGTFKIGTSWRIPIKKQEKLSQNA